MKRVASALVIAAALTSSAYADGVWGASELDTDITGILVCIGFVLVGVFIFAFVVSSTKRSQRRMEEKFRTKAAPSDLPTARVVDRRD